MFLTFYRFIIVRILLGMNKVQSRVCLLPLGVGCVVRRILVAVVLALVVVVVHLVVAAVAVQAAADPLAVHPVLVLVLVTPGPVTVAVGFDDDRAGDDGADMVPGYQT